MQTPAHHSHVPDWLSPPDSLSLQQPWGWSWPAAVLHPDTASNKSCQECESTAVTLICVTAPPSGIRPLSTTSVHCSAFCCSGYGCDMKKTLDWTHICSFYRLSERQCGEVPPSRFCHMVWIQNHSNGNIALWICLSKRVMYHTVIREFIIPIHVCSFKYLYFTDNLC